MIVMMMIIMMVVTFRDSDEYTALHRAAYSHHPVMLGEIMKKMMLMIQLSPYQPCHARAATEARC